MSLKTLLAHGHHRGVHKTDAAAFAKALNLHEEHHMEKHVGHEFNKVIVRNGIEKTAGQILTYVKELVVLNRQTSRSDNRQESSFSHYGLTIPCGCGDGAPCSPKGGFSHTRMLNSCKTHP